MTVHSEVYDVQHLLLMTSHLPSCFVPDFWEALIIWKLLYTSIWDLIMTSLQFMQTRCSSLCFGQVNSNSDQLNSMDGSFVSDLTPWIDKVSRRPMTISCGQIKSKFCTRFSWLSHSTFKTHAPTSNLAPATLTIILLPISLWFQIPFHCADINAECYRTAPSWGCRHVPPSHLRVPTASLALGALLWWSVCLTTMLRTWDSPPGVWTWLWSCLCHSNNDQPSS